MAVNSLVSKVLKSVGKNSRAVVLSQSSFINKDHVFQSHIPIANLMISGSFDGGCAPGVSQICGDARTYKTNFCLSLVKSFMDKHPEGICIFIDCEFGAAKYFDSFDIDKSRVVHIPVENLEEIKFNVTQILDNIDVGSQDKYFFLIDSISQIASKKEAENALNENSAADMTRAREMNSFFRIITPKLQLRNIPLWAINSYYSEMGNIYAEPVLKGGKQAFLSTDVILFVSRSQEKEKVDGKDTLVGWSFNYSVMKSRFVKEKSKFSITVKYDGGISKYSGLFELAEEFGFIYSEKQGFYKINLGDWDADKSWRRKALEDEPSFFDELLKDETFKRLSSEKYALEASKMIQDETTDEVDEETGEIS